MIKHKFPDSVKSLNIHLVGAKGTGMAALAEILYALGAQITGSDISEHFYTESILLKLGIETKEGFDTANLGKDVDLVIHSAAFRCDQNPELIEAIHRNTPVFSYPEALGAISRQYCSSGIAGVHGKTTTTAIAGNLAIGLNIPAIILAGSAVSNFEGHSTKILGDRFFIAETCEYRRHFLFFHPRRIILTSIESDHQDYYPTYADIFAAFIEYALLLPVDGELIFCADDPGAAAAALQISKIRPDIELTPYGMKARGHYRIESYEAHDGRACFVLEGFPGNFELRIPGKHIALDATAAIALSVSILGEMREQKQNKEKESAIRGREYAPTTEEITSIRKALETFAGSKRRSELIGEIGGIIFMDDYGHHPTAIRETIHGIKNFWPTRRLVVDFMSHTYSRTKALFKDFTECFDEADFVIFHKIYSSARELPDTSISGEILYETTSQRRMQNGFGASVYFNEPLDAFTPLTKELKSGDLFLTIGAGDNWKLGQELLNYFEKKEEAHD